MYLNLPFRILRTIRKLLMLIGPMLTGNLYGQEVLGTVKGLHLTHYDIPSATHYQFFADSIAVLNLRGELIHGFRSPEMKKFVLDYQPVIFRGDILLIHRNGGLVYRLTEQGIVRIDKSFENRIQSGSVLFVRKDTIFRHGGYGMWSTRKELIYFNTSTSEWEFYKLNKQSEDPPGIFSHIAYLFDDKLIVLCGYTVNPVDPFVYKWEKRVHIFDFKTRSWSSKGQFNIGNVSTIYKIDGSESGNRNYALTNSMNCFEIDLNTESIKVFETNLLSLHIPQSEFIRPFISNGQLYYYRIANPHGETRWLEEIDLIFCRIPLNEFLTRETEQKNLIGTSVSTEVQLLLAGTSGLFALLIGVAIRRRIKQKTLLKLHGLTLKSGRQELPLTEQEAAVIRLLLEAREDVTTNQLLEITSNPEQDHSYNLRTNKQLIEKLNDDMALLLGIDSDLITTERMRSDRRIRKYTIRKEYFRT